MSGQRYRIRFRDDRLLDAAAYLRAKLAAYPKREPALPRSQGD